MSLRESSKSFRVIVWSGIAIIFLMILVIASRDESQPISASSTPPGRPSALYLCRDWTEKHSKLGVGEVIDQYSLKTKPPKNGVETEKVAIEYRAQGTGLLMKSVCEYSFVGSMPILASAESRPQ